ncbi:unnamed protein product, partial [Phaeothamnion confervicola]
RLVVEGQAPQPLLRTPALALPRGHSGSKHSIMAAVSPGSGPLAAGAWRLTVLLDERQCQPAASATASVGPAVAGSSMPECGIAGDAAQRGAMGGSSGGSGGGSRQPALTPVRCGVKTVFTGVYAANKYLRLFRDVLSADDASPVALRLHVSDGSASVVLRVLHRDTGATIAEARGRAAAEILSAAMPAALLLPQLPTDHSLAPAPAASVPASATAGAHAKGKKGAATELAAATTLTTVIVEAYLDAAAMTVSEHYASRLPHFFSPAAAAAAAAALSPRESLAAMGTGGGLANSTYLRVPTVMGTVNAGDDGASLTAAIAATNAVTAGVNQLQEPLLWTLEIISAAAGIALAHDTTQVVAEAMVVAGWAATDKGRAARARLLWEQDAAASSAAAATASASAAAAVTQERGTCSSAATPPATVGIAAPFAG